MGGQRGKQYVYIWEIRQGGAENVVGTSRRLAVRVYVCLSVCVYMSERERERERDIEGD